MQHLHKCPNTQNDTQTNERREGERERVKKHESDTKKKIKNIQRNYSETCCWQHRSCTESTIHTPIYLTQFSTFTRSLCLSITLFVSFPLSLSQSFSFNIKDHRAVHALTPNNVQHHSQRYARTI